MIQADGSVLGVGEAAAAGAPFDWILASHVIEHIPDLISWFRDLGSIMSPGARLSLVIPDRRYCFDALRPPTTVGDILLAHDNRDTRPSARAVFDYFSSVVTVSRHRPLGRQSPGFVRAHSHRRAGGGNARAIEGRRVHSGECAGVARLGRTRAPARVRVTDGPPSAVCSALPAGSAPDHSAQPTGSVGADPFPVSDRERQLLLAKRSALGVVRKNLRRLRGL